MSEGVLTLASARAMAAEDLAASLTHWQILDIVYVHKTGRMQISVGTPPWRPLQRLIDLGILKPCSVQNSVVAYLVPSHRFRSILENLWRSGRVARPAEVVL